MWCPSSFAKFAFHNFNNYADDPVDMSNYSYL